MSTKATNSTLLVERRGAVLWLTLNDPDRANPLSPATIAALGAALLGVKRRPDGIRAVVLTGAGRTFSAGADLDHLAAIAKQSSAANLADSRRLAALFRTLLECPALTVAMVNGAAIAGGCGLATACDFAIASETATFMYSEAKIGFVAGIVAGILLTRVPGSVARKLLLAPDLVSATRAQEIGLIQAVHPPARLAEEVEAFVAATLASTSPTSIAFTKRLLRELPGTTLAKALALGARLNAECRQTPDCKRGIAEFLKNKRPPSW